VLDLVAPDAEALACAAPIEHCRAIILEGTSADAQLRIFTENEHQGAEIALHKVSGWIRDATLAHDPEKWSPAFGKDHAQENAGARF
jgi:carboxylate-amine ligase